MLYFIHEDGRPRSMWILENSEGGYRHRFGGPSRHRGLVPPGGTAPVQLFYEFDLSDPNLPYHIPGIHWLPLYNGIEYTKPFFQYRMVSDEAIEIVTGEEWVYSKGFPYLDYPQVFPELPCQLGAPKELDFYDDEEEREVIIEDWELSPEDFDDPQLIMAVDAGINNWNGPAKCRNPRCSDSDMLLLAAFRNEWLESAKISIWGGEEYVIITYEICRTCGTIDVANRVN